MIDYLDKISREFDGCWIHDLSLRERKISQYLVGAGYLTIDDSHVFRMKHAVKQS